MMRHAIKVGAGIMALSALTMLAGCSSSGSASSGSGDTIKFFLTYEGPNSVQGSKEEMRLSAEAAATAINKAGGVKGKDIEIVSCANDLDQAKSIKCANQAADPASGIVALVGMLDLGSPVSIPILEAAKLPSVGLWSYGNEIDATSPISYPLRGGSVTTFFVADAFAEANDYTRIGTQPCEFPSCVAPSDQIKALAPDYGLTFTDAVPVANAGLPDYSPVASRSAEGDPEMIVAINGQGPIIGSIKAGADIGFNPRYYADGSAFAEAEAEGAGGALDNIVIGSAFPSPRSQDVPIMKAYVEERAAADGQTAEQYLDGVTLKTGWGNAVNAWLAVHAAVDAINLIPGDDVTKETLTTVLNDPKTSIPLYDFMTWEPAVPGPAGFDRFTDMTGYFLEIDDSGKLVTLPDAPVDAKDAIAKYQAITG